MDEFSPTNVGLGMPMYAQLVFENPDWYPQNSGVVNFGYYSTKDLYDTIDVGEVGTWPDYVNTSFYLAAFIDGNTVQWDPKGFNPQWMPNTFQFFALSQWRDIPQVATSIKYKITALSNLPEPPASPIPELSTLVLLLFGSGILGALSCRRRCKKKWKA